MRDDANEIPIQNRINSDGRNLETLLYLHENTQDDIDRRMERR